MAKYHDHYEKVTWVNGSTALSAEHMNNIESGISDLITYKVEAESGKGLYPDTDKTKLAGIATGAEVNQNAFSNVKVGSTTIAADAKTDTLELVAGSNVTLTPDATNDKVTIAATNTTYSDATTSTHGLMSTSDKTKLNGIATGAEVNQNAFSNVAVSGQTTVAADSKTDTLTLAAGSNVTITTDATNDKVTIAATDTNTWRPVQNNLNSTSATDSLSAAMGKTLKGYCDAKTIYTDLVVTTHQSAHLTSNDAKTDSTISITKSGYYPLGIVGWHCTGQLVSFLNIFSAYMEDRAAGSATIKYSHRITGYSASNVLDGYINFDVLWVKVR